MTEEGAVQKRGCRSVCEPEHLLVLPSTYHNMARLRLVLPFLACTIAVLAAPDLATCPGYKASNIKVLNRGSRLTADLDLAGPACNVYGPEIKTLKLEVDYETGTFFFSWNQSAG